MHVAVLIPGIMGTRLILPAAHNGGNALEVWPPTPLEAATAYTKIAELQSEHLVTGPLIDQILCFGFYNHIQRQFDDLGYAVGTGDPRRVEFAYDWRRDNFDTAAKLAELLKTQHDAGATKFSLICHSMGGLIARLLLESGTYDAEPWFGKIKLLATLGTPHLGAPLALARIFGLDNANGISGTDFKALAANRDYPSGYQLIPAPGEAAIWVANSQDLVPLDPYHATTATQLGMDPVLIARAKAQYDALTGIAPPGVRYFYFAGTGQPTVTRVNVTFRQGQIYNHGESKVTTTVDGGDGTVPIYSALPGRGQRQIVTNEHATVFKGTPFRKVFFRLMGGNAGAALEAADQDTPHLAGTLDRTVYVAGDRPALRLMVETRASDDGTGLVNRIDGALIVERSDDTGNITEKVEELPVKYDGADISALNLTLPIQTETGLFRLRFEGTPEMPEPLAFAVSEG